MELTQHFMEWYNNNSRNRPPLEIFITWPFPCQLGIIILYLYDQGLVITASEMGYRVRQKKFNGVSNIIETYDDTFEERNTMKMYYLAVDKAFKYLQSPF